MSMSVCKRRIKNIIGRVPEMISQSEHSDELDMIIAELDEQFSKYASLLSEKHIDFQDEEGHTEFDRIEASYSDAKLKLKRQSASLRQNAKESSACSDDKMIELLNQQQNILDIMSRQSASASTTRPVDRNEQPMRLPKITIPKFSGDYRQWLTFRDLFETSVIANNSLSDIQKFSYLKSLLSGQAASLITSMPLEGERFSTAWDLVRNRYEKPYLLIQSTISNIVRLQVSPEPQQLRQVLNFLIESWETLKSQGDYARSPDPWAISLFLERVDIESRKSWAEYSSQNDAPSVKEFLDFMEQRCAAEEIFNSGSKNKTKISHSKNPSVRVNFNKVTQCMYCHQNHSIYKCTTFKSLSIKDRENFIIREARCVNCFSRTHNVSDCRSSFTCSTCKGKHNSLLHESKTLGDGSKKNESHSSDTIRVLSSVQHCSSFLLPTVILRARNVFGQFVELRALLDSGAQASLISESFFNKLGIKRDYSRLPITSLTSTGPIFSKGKVTLKLFSRLDDYSFDITAHILQKVMSDLPNEDINLKSSSDLRSEFPLADPTFNVSSPVDIILGASVFFMLLKSKRYLQLIDRLYLQETQVGYVICSREHDCLKEISLNTCSVAHHDSDLDLSLERFWKLEEPPRTDRSLSYTDSECERIYRETTTRLPDGRFTVRLPFAFNPSSLKHSHESARRRFLALERRIHADSELLHEYQRFMSDYEGLGHMERVDQSIFEFELGRYFVIPHHAIWRQNVSGRKLRVVFDASATDEEGTSLNKILHTGPALQTDIIQILLNFRKHRFVLTADIEKMYRQILVDERDQNYQLIFWRSSPVLPLCIYRLKTVTYGQACSPYLAMRSLQELVSQDGAMFPKAAVVLKDNCYVDDILFGGDSLEELRNIQVEVIELLSRGGFVLKKWASNSESSLDTIPTEDLSNPKIFGESVDQSIKTLGIRWDPKQDSFFFHCNPLISHGWTKRALLSEAARIYDPCGWLSPITVVFKLLFQQTWVRQLGWDVILPESIICSWRKLRDELALLKEVRIPRFIGHGRMEIHGFSDASRDAYGAVIYTRLIDDDGNISVNLLMSKSKIAPIKQISIPRLELCAAHLLARCIHSISHSFNCNPSNTFLWSDSSTVLAWIKSTPKKWTPFVGNRVSHVHELCPRIRWLYINTRLNPADHVSRGLLPSQLYLHPDWWTGPQFLSQAFMLPADPDDFQTCVDQRPVHINVGAVTDSFWLNFIDRFSSFNRLIRTLAYIFRFRDHLKHKFHQSGILLASEVRDATSFVISRIQESSFNLEIEALLKNLPVPSKSHIRTLNPFIDERGVLRVGGRLRNVISDQFNSTPIIIPKGNFARLLIGKLHNETFHGGLRLVLSLIRRDFWIPGLRQMINSFIHSCSRCRRYQSLTYDPQMGELPSERVNPSKPFSTTGIDFAGPICLRPTRGRGNTSVKAWIAIFVCFSTKALHLELIMSLSTNSLILGLRRFIARRGHCGTFVSDNGRNFVGCAAQLRAFQREIRDCAASSQVSDFLHTRAIEWKFIPAYSPNFGGLWEAGVKSVKRHLHRTFNGSRLSIEEMMTALCQIESILNSRPLTPISFYDSGYNPITPAHLLTGEPISSFPDLRPRLGETSSATSRVRMISNLIRGFWKRWRNEYLDCIMQPKLQVCSSAGTATGCCSEAVERQFFHYGKNSFTKKLREAISKLSSILRSRYKKFNEYFQEMLNKSQSDFNEMFTQTYGILYVQNSNVFTNFFQQLQNYYINGDMDMTVVLDNFFVTLYKRMFEVINSQYKFDKKYLSCATDQMQELKPFGDIPNRLSIQLKRSFIATRSFSQALDVGATIAKNMLKINLTEECLKSLLNMQFCSACSATIEIHACSNYCINVMKGCLAHFTELESDWNAYVDAIDKITDRLLGSYNIKIVVEPIDIKISDAIMMFQENGQIISQKVFNTCGQPVHNRKSRSTMVQRGRGGGGGGRNRISKRQNSHHEKRNSKRRRKSKNSNQLPLLRHHEPQTGQNFEKIVKEIKIKIKEAKYFWSHLPYLFCNDKNLAEGPSRNIHCWNGTVVDRYLPSIVRDGFVNQKDNPSVIVDVNKRSKVLFEQMLLLKSISKKLQNAHQGVDVNWTENENIADEIAGSGFVWTDDSIDNDPKQIEEKWKLIENPVSPFETTPSINNRPFTRPATATIIITTTKPIPDTNRSNSIDFSISASTTTIMSKTTTTTTTPFSTNDIFDGDTSNEIDTGSFAFPITPHHPFTLLVINLIVILYTCFV